VSIPEEAIKAEAESADIRVVTMSREDHAEHADGMTRGAASVATLMPTLPSPPQRTAPAAKPTYTGPQGNFTPGQMAAQGQPELVAPAAPPPTRERRTLPDAWRRAALGTVAAVLVAAGGYAGYRRVVHYDNKVDPLPTFTTPAPAYGTVSFHLVDKQKGVTTEAQVETDGTASVTHTLLTSGGATSEFITDGKAIYSRPTTTGVWAKKPYDDSLQQFEAATAQLHLATFGDIVPAVAEPYVHLVADSTEAVNGKMLHRYDLVLYMQRFRSAVPAAYAAWAGRLGAMADVPVRARFVVWVDANGVVWQEKSSNDDGTDAFMLTMLDHSDKQFVPAYPTEFVDNTSSSTATTATTATAPASPAVSAPGISVP